MVVSTIGAFELEQKAFDLMSRLVWQLPLFMVVAALSDLLLVLVYMNWLHPWRGILEDVSMHLIFNTCLAKGPEIWGPLADKGSPEVPIQSVDQDNILMKPLPNKVNRIFLLIDAEVLSSVT